MNENRDPSATEKKLPEPLPIDAADRLDWDFDIGERPPPLRKWKQWGQIRYKKAEPLPMPDPDQE